MLQISYFALAFRQKFFIDGKNTFDIISSLTLLEHKFFKKITVVFQNTMSQNKKACILFEFPYNAINDFSVQQEKFDQAQRFCRQFRNYLLIRLDV